MYYLTGIIGRNMVFTRKSQQHRGKSFSDISKNVPSIYQNYVTTVDIVKYPDTSLEIILILKR